MDFCAYLLYRYGQNNRNLLLYKRSNTASCVSIGSPHKKRGSKVGYTVKEVLQFVKENDVKFVRLVFFDIFGVQKNISIMSYELERVFEYGASITTEGIEGFEESVSTELLLFPDPATLKVMPWRPQNGGVVRLLCDIRLPDGTPFEGDVRRVLKKAAEYAARSDIRATAGLACEFYLFRTDENGSPTRIPHDHAGYLDVAPLDKGENVRRQICLTLEEMELEPLSSHHESGPGQNEIDFKHSELLTCADNFTAFKTVVKTAAASNGLYASFMPKPLSDQNGSGMHINLGIRSGGSNLFRDTGNGLSETAKSFIAGIMEHARELTLFFNPLANSYQRFGAYKAPDTVDWSYRDCNTLLRLPEFTTERARLDFRSPDSSCNIYLALALLLYAGLDGVSRQLSPCPPAGSEKKPEYLPLCLEEAVECAKNGSFAKKYLPGLIYEGYIGKKSEAAGRISRNPEYLDELNAVNFMFV